MNIASAALFFTFPPRDRETQPIQTDFHTVSITPETNNVHGGKFGLCIKLH